MPLDLVRSCLLVVLEAQSEPETDLLLVELIDQHILTHVGQNFPEIRVLQQIEIVIWVTARDDRVGVRQLDQLLTFLLLPEN